MAKRGLNAERFFHEIRDEFGLLAEALLKLLAVRQQTHGAAQQAGRGFTSSGQQSLQNHDAHPALNTRSLCHS